MTLRERLTASVGDIRERGQRLAQLNRELLASELKEKGGRFAGALGLFAGAGLLAVYAVGFALATIAVALALVLPLWLSLLIVTVVLFIVVLILALVGRSLVRQAQPPSPQAATAEAKATGDLVRANVRETVDGVRARAPVGRYEVAFLVHRRAGEPVVGLSPHPNSAAVFDSRVGRARDVSKKRAFSRDSAPTEPIRILGVIVDEVSPRRFRTAHAVALSTASLCASPGVRQLTGPNSSSIHGTIRLTSRRCTAPAFSPCRAIASCSTAHDGGA